MLAVLFAVTMTFGILLFVSLSARKPAAGALRLVHRSLAILSIAAAVWKGGVLLCGSAVLVGAVGFSSARIRTRNDALATMLFLTHVVGAISLLVITALSIAYGFGPGH